MSDDWLAVPGPDPGASAREIAKVRDAFLAGERRAGRRLAVRGVVAQSWRRSAKAQVDPGQDPPVTMCGSELEAYRAEHPLSGVIGLLRELVGAVAEDGRHLMAVTDASGRLLWVEGHAASRRQAAAMNFVEGSVWDEKHAGTNAPGTALAVDHAVQIFSSEHFRPNVQAWTCSAAPIHDPATGEILGIVDVTGGDNVAHPHSLALVNAAARAAEAQLGARADWNRRGGGELWLPARRDAGEVSERASAQLLALGRDQALLCTGGKEIRLGRRHSEVLVILAQHPEGLTGDQIASALYDDDASETTVRVEVARVRRVLGDLVCSRPYRLRTPLAADFLDVAKALREKDPAAALSAYGGPLLPGSEAPAVVAERHWIDVRLRTAVLESGRPDVLEDWLDRFGAEDLDAWEQLADTLPPSARKGEAMTQVRRLGALADPWERATLRQRSPR